MRVFYAILGVWALACSPPQNPNCDLNLLNNSNYRGDVRYCNASVDQLTIRAVATIEVIDSFLVLHLMDVDSIHDYQLIDTALVKCVYWEGNINYEIYPNDMPTAERIGVLSTDGAYLHWDILRFPCPESTAFIGQKE